MPALADKPVYFLAPVIATDPGVPGLLGHPAGADGQHLRRAHPAAAHRRPHRRPRRARLLGDGRLRHRAGRLGVRLDLPAARRRCAAPRRWSATRSRWGCRSSRCSSTPARCRRRRSSPPRPTATSCPSSAGVHRAELVRRPAAGLLRHLRDRRGRRDQPGALRPPRGRERAGRRLPHRVLVAEVRALLPGRVHQHGHRLGAGRDAVPRRLAGARGRSRSGTAPTPAGGRCSGSSSRSSSRCSSSSGCAARCPGCATTSSCASAGRSWSRPRWSGSSSSPRCARCPARPTSPPARSPSSSASRSRCWCWPACWWPAGRPTATPGSWPSEAAAGGVHADRPRARGPAPGRCRAAGPPAARAAPRAGSRSRRWT